MIRLAACLLISPFLASAQDGLTAPWQLKHQIESLMDYCRRLTPVVDQLHPADWNGAAPGYIEQHKIVREQLQSLLLIAGKVAKTPERLPIVMDLYFRFESFDMTLASLLEGVRKYQNPAVAELVTGMRTEQAGLREQLKTYMLELADTKDQEFRIADQEAQRCRAAILKPPGRK